MIDAHVLSCAPAGAISAEVTAYGDYLGHLLGNPDRRWQAIPAGADGDDEWLAATAALDLLVYVDPERSWWRRCLLGPPARGLVERVQTSLLIVRQPRWPIRHILLVVRGETTDWAALDWAVRLAHPRRTLVSLLPIVPPWPSLHRLSRAVQPPPEVLLSPCTPSGAQLHGMVQRLHRRRIPAVVSLRQGEPDDQIRAEVLAGNPDLVVIAAEAHSRLLRRLGGELVAPLLGWIDRPVLIAKKSCPAAAPRRPPGSAWANRFYTYPPASVPAKGIQVRLRYRTT